MDNRELFLAAFAQKVFGRVRLLNTITVAKFPMTPRAAQAGLQILS